MQRIAGRSLEDIDVVFENSNPMTPWDVVLLSKYFKDLKYNQLEVYQEKVFEELRE